MEGKIDHQGFLYIKRGSKLERMECPFKTRFSEYSHPTCNHKCPHFGEPEHTTPEMCSQYTAIYLTCGHSKFMRFDTFTDERA